MKIIDFLIDFNFNFGVFQFISNGNRCLRISLNTEVNYIAGDAINKISAICKEENNRLEFKENCLVITVFNLTKK